MTNSASNTLTIKKIMELNRSIDLLHTPDMINHILAQGTVSDEVKELLALGLAAYTAEAALKKRLAEHQAAYDATLPLRDFQTLEAAFYHDGDSEPDIKHGVYEARTAAQAVALAHAAGEGAVTHAMTI